MAYYLEAYLVEEDLGESLGTAEFSGLEEALDIPMYEVVRQSLGPEYRNFSDLEIHALLENILGSMSPEEVEGFWDTVKSAGQAALGVAKQVAPTVLPIAGGAVGTLIGGPVGTAIGSKLGQMGAQLLTKPQAPGVSAAAIPPVAAPGAPPQPPSAAAPAVAPVPAGGTTATAQLMALLQNPALLKSLLGQLLGGAGESAVLVGPRATPIPFGAMMNALESLAAQAALEAAEAYEDDSEAVRHCPSICRRRYLTARDRQKWCRSCPALRIRRVPPRRPVVRPVVPSMAEPGERPSGYGEEPYAEEPYGGEPYGEEPSGGEERFKAMSYLQDESGNFIVDPANPDERAQRVLELLQEAVEAYVPESYDPVTEWLIEAEML
jgi:hypothetical protein